jgi:hypothetical protein
LSACAVLCLLIRLSGGGGGTPFAPDGSNSLQPSETMKQHLSPQSRLHPLRSTHRRHRACGPCCIAATCVCLLCQGCRIGFRVCTRAWWCTIFEYLWCKICNSWLVCCFTVALSVVVHRVASLRHPHARHAVRHLARVRPWARSRSPSGRGRWSRCPPHLLPSARWLLAPLCSPRTAYTVQRTRWAKPLPAK